MRSESSSNKHGGCLLGMFVSGSRGDLGVGESWIRNSVDLKISMTWIWKYQWWTVKFYAFVLRLLIGCDFMWFYSYIKLIFYSDWQDVNYYAVLRVRMMEYYTVLRVRIRKMRYDCIEFCK